MSRRELSSLLDENARIMEDAKERAASQESAKAEEHFAPGLVDIFRDFERQGWRNISLCKMEATLQQAHVVLPLSPNAARRASLRPPFARVPSAPFSTFKNGPTSGGENLSYEHIFWDLFSPEIIAYLSQKLTGSGTAERRGPQGRSVCFSEDEIRSLVRMLVFAIAEGTSVAHVNQVPGYEGGASCSAFKLYSQEALEAYRVHVQGN